MAPERMTPKRMTLAAVLVLTHMSREMLARAATVPEECAHDGLVISL